VSMGEEGDQVSLYFVRAEEAVTRHEAAQESEDSRIYPVIGDPQ